MNDGIAKTAVVFAYGSNMLTKRMTETSRCPHARVLGSGELRGYELRWHKRSRRDGSGKCDVVASGIAGAAVYGVLYEISLAEKAALDRAEGLGKGYGEKEVAVLSGGEPVRALAYYATDTDSSLRSYTWYRDLVVAGAEEHGLPAPYITQLRATYAVQDPDQARHEASVQLLGRLSAR